MVQLTGRREAAVHCGYLSISFFLLQPERENVLFTAVKVGHSSFPSRPIWECVSSHTWSSSYRFSFDISSVSQSLISHVCKCNYQIWNEEMGGTRLHTPPSPSSLLLLFASVTIPPLPLSLNSVFFHLHLTYFIYTSHSLMFSVFPRFNHLLSSDLWPPPRFIPFQFPVYSQFCSFSGPFSMYSLSRSPHSPLNHHSLPSSITSCFFASTSLSMFFSALRARLY